MFSRTRRRARVGIPVSVGAGVLLLTGCTPTLTVTTAVTDPTPKVSIATAPQSGTGIDPDTQVVIEADLGRLTRVSVLGSEGEVPGILSEDGSRWTATGATLDYSATYTIAAQAADARGRLSIMDSTFSTLEPEKFFKASVSPSAGEVVGVGESIVVTFNKKVKNKAEVEAALIVRTSEPVLGAWAWRGNRTVEFRPKELWPGNMNVEVDLNLTGVQAKSGVFGRANTIDAFSFRPSMVSVVDAKTHTMDVYRGGKLLRSIPVTTGKPGFETRSGTKVLMTKERSRIMDAATGGTSVDSPDYYRVNAEYAMRITNSGEFIHAAPWSTGSQGSANVSHGCIGMSTANGEWWWNQNQIGDVVIVENTPIIQGDDGNGLTVWNAPWDEWLAKSLTGPQFTKPLNVESASVDVVETQVDVQSVASANN
jgi:lipoprotein-anchoring transpeptidase ErfK/SrfK